MAFELIDRTRAEESKILFKHALVYGDSGIEGRGCDREETDITETL